MVYIKRNTLLFIIVLIIINIFLHFYNLGETPYGNDEKYIMIPRHHAMISSPLNFIFVPATESWEKEPTYNYDSPHLNYGMQSATSPFYWWAVSFSTLLFGETAFGLRFIVAFFAVLYIVVFYFLIRHSY